MSLRTELEAAGLNVKTVTGWGTRGYKWKLGKPIGIMEHHTAPPVPYPVSALYGDLLKCNINTKPDGTVWLIAQKACNYSSGSGSSVVLAEAQRGEPPTQNARERGLIDEVSGNPYFWNFENDHAGDGGPIPQVQLDAIVTATRVVLDRYGLEPGNVISHAEWTTRKRDPFWNGSLRAIEAIREQLEDTMPLTDEDVQKVAEATRRAILSAQFGMNDMPDGSQSNLQLKFDRTYRNTQTIIAAVGALDLEGVSEAELDERVAELAAVIAAQPAAFIAKLKAQL